MRELPLLFIFSLLLHICFFAESNKTSLHTQINTSSNVEILDEVRSYIEENHPTPYTTISKKAFKKKIERLKKTWHRMNKDEQYFSLRYLCSLGDAHTTILRNKLEAKTLPFFILPYGKHSVIVQVDAKYKELVGKELLQVNGYKIDTIFKKLLLFISHDKLGWGRLQAHYECRFVSALQYLKIVNNDATEVTVKYKDIKNGKIETISVKFSPTAQIESPIFANLAPTLFQVGYYRAFALQDVLFIQYNVCADAPDLPMKDFALQIGNVTSNFKKIIIDLRHNAGGNSKVISSLIEVLKNLNEHKLFAIVGGGTFSSGVMATTALKEIGATIIGEEVGWNGKFGEVKSFPLKDSELTLLCSTKDFSSIESLTTLRPDILMSEDLNDLASGLDTIVDYITNLE